MLITNRDCTYLSYLILINITYFDNIGMHISMSMLCAQQNVHKVTALWFSSVFETYLIKEDKIWMVNSGIQV